MIMGVINSIKEYLANRKNYGSSRDTKKIKYIVIHYTANDGDTDENNSKYFRNNVVGSSAHYFVDGDSITQSVPDNHIAWAVGGNKYNNSGGRLYGQVTNANSISIELCDEVKNGKVYPSDKTIANALELTYTLMNKYSIPKENVIRHYDVNGKPCPQYWVVDSVWKSEFWNKIGQKSPNYIKVQKRFSFSNDTMNYLQGYKYADALLDRLANTK